MRLFTITRRTLALSGGSMGFIAMLPKVRAASPSSAEAALAEHIAGGAKAARSLLHQLVAINSGTLNPAGVRHAGELLQDRLAKIGFTVRWEDMHALGRGGNLFAERLPSSPKPGMPRILLLGHIDTVFEMDSPFQHPRDDGDLVSGPGAADMKGGLVVMLGALEALSARGLLDGLEIRVALTGDEEKTGKPHTIGRAGLVAVSDGCDAVLEFEPMLQRQGEDRATIARRGSVGWTLQVEGKPGHSMNIFNESSGFGANYELARIVDAFRRELREPSLTYNVGVIAGGDQLRRQSEDTELGIEGKINIIPQIALARGDIRALSPEQESRTKEAMVRICADSLPGTKAQIAFEDGYPPVPVKPGSEKLLQMVQQISRDFGLPAITPLPPAERGAGDAGFVNDRPAVLMGLGLAGEHAHSEKEVADFSTYVRQATRVAVLMSRLAANPALI